MPMTCCAWMTDHGRFGVDRWLRTEALLDDVLALLAELGELAPGAEEAVGAVGRVNEGDYPSELASASTADQLARLYALNPVWARDRAQRVRRPADRLGPGPEGRSDGDRRVLGRERRAAEEPVLDRVARVWHRRIGARLVQEQLVEEQRVAGLEDRPDDRRRRRRASSTLRWEIV